jgi:hypothetical protein
MVTMQPKANTLNFPKASQARPMSGPETMENAPVITYRSGNWPTGSPMLCTMNTLMKGISMKPPTLSKPVVANPCR